MKKNLILTISIILLILLGIGWLGWKRYEVSVNGISISTDRREYAKGENPKIKIKNNLEKTVCFSSCYPYYLERNNGKLKPYSYSSDCLSPDLSEVCIEPGQVKAFELILDGVEVEEAFHRVAVPACIGCALKESFRKDKIFYSNRFEIK